jgi:hypothetical protein
LLAIYTFSYWATGALGSAAMFIYIISKQWQMSAEIEKAGTLF